MDRPTFTDPVTSPVILDLTHAGDAPQLAIYGDAGSGAAFLAEERARRLGGE